MTIQARNIDVGWYQGWLSCLCLIAALLLVYTI
jgi:hypothetical protein